MTDLPDLPDLLGVDLELGEDAPPRRAPTLIRIRNRFVTPARSGPADPEPDHGDRPGGEPITGDETVLPGTFEADPPVSRHDGTDSIMLAADGPIAVVNDAAPNWKINRITVAGSPRMLADRRLNRRSVLVIAKGVNVAVAPTDNEVLHEGTRYQLEDDEVLAVDTTAEMWGISTNATPTDVQTIELLD